MVEKSILRFMPKLLLTILSISFSNFAFSQTDVDGLFMAKRNFCGGIMAASSKWDHYWEGTLYRNNLNIGTVSSQNYMAMGNYGITDQLNVIVMAPYIKNQASAGTLIGQQGIQDLSIVVKKELITKKVLGCLSSLIVLVGGSIPLTNYVADYLPLSIGMQSKNGLIRLMADVQRKYMYITASGFAMLRSNVTIDRTAYYTTKMIYSNQVYMPAVAGFNFRFGFRDGADKVLEFVVDGMNTLGGFDIRRNDMPFLSNNMDALRLGINAKYLIPKTNGLSLMAAWNQVVLGRNIGQTQSFMGGLVYQLEFIKKQKKEN